MMNSVLIVTNINAGRKCAVKYKKDVVNFVLKYTKSFKSINIDELDSIDISNFDTIFVMGGDGTVNKILPLIVNTDKKLGIIPCGTANLLASKLGLSSNINKTLKIIEQNNIKNIDILNINNSLCALRCGFGYDCDIICKTPQLFKNKFGYLAYFLSGILFAFRLKNKEYKIKTDTQIKSTKASCLIISNSANMYKNLISVARDSKIDDGLMDIFIIKTCNPIILFIEILLIILNIKINSKKVEYFKSKYVNIDNTWQVCHIDGEKRNLKENISINIIKKSIQVFCKS